MIETIKILWQMLIGRGIPCPFKFLTGLYCPGCGGTRAVWLLLTGHIFLSIQYHPLVLYAALMTAVELIGYCLAKKLRRPRLYLGRYGLVVSVGTAIVFVNWIFKNYMLIVRGVDLLPPL